jgi:hypothetical protein
MPTAAKLAPIRSIRRQLHSQSSLTIRNSFVRTDLLILPIPQKYLYALRPLAPLVSTTDVPKSP